ncbi:MAG: hypothetical protein ACKVPX_16305 [Myxococcaceae bacterium]
MSALRPLFLALRAAIARFQLTVGLGFLSVVLGSLLAAKLLPWAQRVSSHRPMAEILLYGGLSRIWVWGVLPLLALAVARWIPVHPWMTALGAALTGEAFLVALDFGISGLEPWAARPGFLVVRLLTLVIGIGITARGVAWRRRTA